MLFRSALLLVGFVWTCVEYDFTPEGIILIIGLILCIWSALLMVSNFKFASPKQIDVQGRVPFVVILTPVFCLAVFFINPPVVMLLVALAYSFSGPIFTILKKTS